MVRVTSWILRFLQNLRKTNSRNSLVKSQLTVQEFVKAETYWISVSQNQCFSAELRSLSSKDALLSNSSLITLHPFIDSQGVLRVSGRKQEFKLAYPVMHPIILDGKHQVTKLIIQTEHVRLLHAGPFLMSSLNRRYHIIGGRRIVCSITRSCIICRRRSQKPNT